MQSGQAACAGQRNNRAAHNVAATRTKLLPNIKTLLGKTGDKTGDKNYWMLTMNAFKSLWTSSAAAVAS